MKITKSNLYTQIEQVVKRPKDHAGPGYDVGTLQRLALLSTDDVEVARLIITAQDGAEAGIYVPIEDVPAALDRLESSTVAGPLGARKVEINYGRPGEKR